MPGGGGYDSPYPSRIYNCPSTLPLCEEACQRHDTCRSGRATRISYLIVLRCRTRRYHG